MFKFTPFIKSELQELIEEKETLNDLINTYGSPCNIIFPQNMKENIEDFKKVLNKNHLKSKIFYAHKCNKSLALVKEAKKNGICIDVASENELKDALFSGFNGESIEATGPKNKNFIILGLQHNITFNVDNLDELKHIIFYSKKIDKKEKTRILIRVKDFYSDETKIVNKMSRFGFSIKSIDNILRFVLNNTDNLNFIGFSFHLDTAEIKEKIIAIENCIELFEKCYDIGLNPTVLDIGGGFKDNYILSKEEWNESISILKQSISGSNNEKLTFNDNSFGLYNQNGVVRGSLNIYEYYNDIVRDKYLDVILNSKILKYQNRTIGEILSDNMIELYIEPGKSLLSNVGITISKVVYQKECDESTVFVGLDMKKTDILVGEQELFVDPIIISNSKMEITNKGIYFLGNLCLENDLIYRHKIFPEFMPNEDDLILFSNTAGYFMDFNSSDTAKQRIATKVIMIKDKEKFKTYMDDTYSPYLLGDAKYNVI